MDSIYLIVCPNDECANNAKDRLVRYLFHHVTRQLYIHHRFRAIRFHFGADDVAIRIVSESEFDSLMKVGYYGWMVTEFQLNEWLDSSDMAICES